MDKAGTSKEPPTPRVTRSKKVTQEICVDCLKPLDQHPGKIYRCVVCNAPQHEICHMLYSVVDEEDNFYCAKHRPKDKPENEENSHSEEEEEQNASDSDDSIVIDSSEEENCEEENCDEKNEKEKEKENELKSKMSPPKVKQKLCKKCHNPVNGSDNVYCKICKSAFHSGCAQYNNQGLVCSFCEELMKFQFSNTSFSKNYHKKGLDDSTKKNSTMKQNADKDAIIQKLQMEMDVYKAQVERKLIDMQHEIKLLEVKMIHNIPLPTMQPSTSNNATKDTAVFDVMSKLLENQMKQNDKIALKSLPVVNKIGAEWLVFYKAFVQTKCFYTPQENVTRLQQAILCEEVKKIGGTNLFTPETCNDAVERINKLINRPEDLLRKNAKEVLSMKVSNDKKDRKSFINYIVAVNNYANYQLNLGTNRSQNDSALIEKFAAKLPIYMNEKWQEFCVKKENQGRTVSIQDLSSFLEEKLAILLRMQSVETAHDKEAKPETKTQGEGTAKTSNKNNARLYNTNTKPAYDYRCWVDQSDDHPISKCSKAMSMSGLEVLELAKKLGVCTLCGREKFTGPGHRCKSQPPPECKYHPQQRHWATVCPTRKAYKQPHNAYQRDRQSSRGFAPRGRGGRNYNTRQYTQSSENGQLNTHGTNNSDHQQPPTQSQPPQAHNQSQPPSSFNNSRSYNQERSDVPSDVNLNFYRGNYHTNFSQGHNYENFNGMIRGIMQLNNNRVNNHEQFKSSPHLLSVIVMKLGTRKVPTAFLLDSGSTISLIDAKIADELGLEGYRNPLTLLWSGNQSRVDEWSRIVSVETESYAIKPIKHVLYFQTFRKLQIAPQLFDANEIKLKYPHLRELCLESYYQIGGVIGIDQPKAFIKNKSLHPKTYSNEVVIGFSSPLGDYAIGTFDSIAARHKYHEKLEKSKNTQMMDINNFRHQFNIIAISQNTNLKSFDDFNEWENLLMGKDYFQEAQEGDRNSAEDQQALEIFEQKTYKDENNVFQTPLLFKDENVILPSEKSFKVAFHRHKTMECHLVKAGIYEEAKSEIDNLLKKNYAEEVTNDSLVLAPSKIFYNPIFFIKPAEKRTRLIWNAAADVGEGITLNSFLMTGPNLYNNLHRMLFRMREHKYILKGDISEMFHRIGIIPEHRDALRFLFSEHPGGPTKIYRMKRMVFGANCSPSASQFTMHKNAEQFKLEFPNAYETIKNDFYVDDWLKSVESLEEGQQLVSDVRYVLAQGNFQIAKLGSNHPDMMNNIKLKLTEEEKLNEKLFSGISEEKILGYVINFENDTIKLSLKMEKIAYMLEENFKPTKVEVLRFNMSHFDPIGFTMFYTCKMKLLYHWVCSNKIDWEQPIPDDLLKSWKQIVIWHNQLQNVEIPRCYSTKLTPGCKRQLWIFTDAGKEAQCIVAYMRIVSSENKQIEIALIGSKNFIVPAKQKRTIPELEFDTIVKGIKFACDIKENHSVKFDKVKLLTDSTAAYAWLVNGIQKPTVYLKNRMKKISMNNITIEFCWVPTEYQPADFGTKFSAMPSLNYESDWFKPKFFSLPEEEWPTCHLTQSSAITNHIMNKSVKSVENYTGKFINIKRYSTLNKALYAAGRLLLKWLFKTKFSVLEEKIENCKKNPSRSNRHLAKELKEKKVDLEILANDINYRRENFLSAYIKDAQEEKFPEEIKLLRSGNDLPRKHSLSRLMLTLDENDLLRTTTRITRNDINLAKFGENMITQKLLPKDHHLTKLIVLHHHAQNKHMHYDTVSINIQKEYYIPHIKWVVRKFIREECYLCKLTDGRTLTPIMGDLPNEKLCNTHHPFTNIMVDCCGPFLVTQGRATVKRWMLVITCMTVRAVNIEILHTMSTDSVITALFNHFSIRGMARKIYSDQGTNFIGAINELRRSINLWNKKKMEKGLETWNIEWEVSPAYAPNMNGSVERLIGCTKRALKKTEKIMQEKLFRLNEEKFRMVTCEIIGLLNNRPLCMVPIKGTVNKFLTPNYFLIGRENCFTIPISGIPRTLKNYWEDLLEIQGELWHHWLEFYIPQHLRRQKWVKRVKNLEKGDIVLTADQSITNSWRLAVVIDAPVGSQNQTRKVTLKLGKADLIDFKQQPITKESLKKLYAKEKCSVVTRPTSVVIPLNLKNLFEE